MTDKEKIIAHIDRLLEKYPNNYYLLVVAEFIDSMQKELISEDLEEASEDYTRKVLERTNCLIGNQPVGEEISKAVEFGANWQKEQLMAKAVDGYVIEDIEEGNGDFLLSTDYLPKSMSLKDQQGVKVIVIKED